MTTMSLHSSFLSVCLYACSNDCATEQQMEPYQRRLHSLETAAACTLQDALPQNCLLCACSVESVAEQHIWPAKEIHMSEQHAQSELHFLKSCLLYVRSVSDGSEHGTQAGAEESENPWQWQQRHAHGSPRILQLLCTSNSRHASNLCYKDSPCTESGHAGDH